MELSPGAVATQYVVRVAADDHLPVGLCVIGPFRRGVAEVYSDSLHYGAPLGRQADRDSQARIKELNLDRVIRHTTGPFLPDLAGKPR